MVSFWVYDVTFLVLFMIGVVVFLYTRKHNLERQGIMYLYKTKLGIKLMDWTVSRFGRVLKPLQYVVVASGFILMISMLWLMIKTAYVYVSSPIIAQLIRAPPIAPLIPYFPKLFNLESFFPPLYFTFFLIALLVVAVSHEFSHGIFARLNKIKIKTTGFAFLGPILGAFVEPDEKQMQKSKKFPQMAILAAGTFANVIMTVIFGLILWAFFAFSFTPAGVNFNTYSSSAINLSSIDSISGVPITNLVNDVENLNSSLVEISSEGKTYFVSGSTLKLSAENNINELVVFEDAPAVNARLVGAITEIGGMSTTSIPELQQAIAKHSPGEEVIIKTIGEDGISEYNIVLGNNEGKAYLGIGFVQADRSGLTGWFASQVERVKSPFIYYAPTWDGDFAIFLYQGLWWIVVINILVALFNMLPVSILDGGRFFYLTIWGVTGSEKFGRRAFKFMNWFILALLVAMMIRWFLIFI